MEINEQDKWLYFYTLPCTGGNILLFENLKKIGEFNKYLNGDFSREKVRRYFLGEHNIKSLKKTEIIEENKIGEQETMGIHLLIPYRVNYILEESLTCTIYQPFYDIANLTPSRIFAKSLDTAIELEVIQEYPKQGDILLVHGDYIVDVVEEKEFKKYRKLFENNKRALFRKETSERKK